MKKSTRSSQSCKFGKILQCWKNLSMLPSTRFLVWLFLCQKVRQWLPPCVFHDDSHCLTFWQRNILSKNLVDGNNNIFSVWRFGCLEAEQKPVLTSLSRNCQKLPCTETKIAQPPKQVHRSTMWHMKDNGQGYLFCKWVFIDLSSC